MHRTPLTPPATHPTAAQDARVRVATAHDAEAITALVCAELGPTYTTTAAVQSLTTAQVVRVADRGGQVVAVGIGCSLADHPGALNGLAPPPGDVGVVKTLVVHPQARGLGLGKALLAAVTTGLVAAGHDTLAAVSWRSGRERTSEPLFTGAGWQVAQVVANAWTALSIELGFDCPVCANPCRCTGVLFTRPAHLV